tara:strand:- start:736 stop:1173 length:438 start_codon:yes stop_codon:yes gene_type:complete
VNENNAPLATVGALVVSPSNKVLITLTHKWRNTWGIPGGKINYGEELRAALVREIREETSLEINNIRWAPTQEMVLRKTFYRPAHFILLNFVACSNSEKVILNEEAQDYAWVFPKEALVYELNEPTRRLINYFIEHGHTGNRLDP